MKKENIVNDYYDNGYVVIDDVISDNQNKNILNELNKFNKNEFHNLSNENKFLNKNNSNGFMYIGQPHVKSKIIYKQIFNKKIIKTLTQILGLNIPFWDGGIKFVQSMLNTQYQLEIDLLQAFGYRLKNQQFKTDVCGLSLIVINLEYYIKDTNIIFQMLIQWK